MPEPSQFAQLFVDLEELTGKLIPNAMSEQEKFLLLSKKVHFRTFAQLRADRYYKRRVENFDDLKVAIMEKAEEDWLERSLFQHKRENLHAMQDSQAPSKVMNKPNIGKGHPKPKPKAQSRQIVPNDPKTKEPPKFHATIHCKFCGKKGHYDYPCWQNTPKRSPQTWFQDPSSLKHHLDLDHHQQHHTHHHPHLPKIWGRTRNRTKRNARRTSCFSKGPLSPPLLT
jgi:hypothetical protein